MRASSRSFRFLLESIALNLILRDAKKSRDDYADIAGSLPFSSDTNTGMGILFKAYGDAVCYVAGGVDVITRAGSGTSGASEEEMESVKAAKIHTLTLLAPAFPNVKNVTGELERGFRFWASVSSPIPFLSHFYLV